MQIFGHLFAVAVVVEPEALATQTFTHTHPDAHQPTSQLIG